MKDKSNDSFQWTSELKGIYISELERELFKNGMLPESFRKKFVESHIPKPQADNKPDWEIVEFIGSGGMIYKKLSNSNAYTSFDNFGHGKLADEYFLTNSNYKIHSVRRHS